MTNSSLVDYTLISPNNTRPRNHEIDTVTIHHVVGLLSVETLGLIMYDSEREMSSNYVIGEDGRKGLTCEEKNRSWCSSSYSNDNRAITIEVANNGFYPYAVSDVVMESLIELLVDICKRNPKLSNGLRWKNDSSLIGNVEEQNMTLHQWFAPTACPGTFLHDSHYYIAEEVNRRLEAEKPLKPNPPTGGELEEELYSIQIGSFSTQEKASEYAETVKDKGFQSFVSEEKIYRVRVGEDLTETEAEFLIGELKDNDINGFKTLYTSDNTIRVGSLVEVIPGSKTYSGGTVSNFVFGMVYEVSSISGDRVVLDSKGLNTPFNINDLIKV